MAKIKQKTHSGASKRFKLKANGRVKRKQAYTSHLNMVKNPDRVRRSREDAEINASDLKGIYKLIGAPKKSKKNK